MKGARGIGTGETGFLFRPPTPGQRVNAGLLVLDGATGTVSIVDAAGAPLAPPIAYQWPAGYHVQASTVFDAFGIPPSPSARIVYAVTKGRVLPFGTATDPASGDPVDLPVFGPTSTAAFQWIPGVERGGGPLGRRAHGPPALRTGPRATPPSRSASAGRASLRRRSRCRRPRS